MTAPFARALLGWKQSGKNKLGWPLVPNFADVDNAESIRIGHQDRRTGVAYAECRYPQAE